MVKIRKKKVAKGSGKKKVFKLDINRAKRRLKKEEKSRKRRRKDKFFNFEPDTRTVIRILPPWSARAAREGRLARLVYTHFGIPVFLQGEKRNKNGNWCTCGAMTDPESYETCPICEVMDDFANEVNVKRMRPSGKMFSNAVVRGDDEEEDKRVIIRGPVGLYDHIDAQIDDPDIGDISDVKEGFDLIVKRVGKTLDDTVYTYNTRPKTRKLSDDPKEAADWIANLVDLDKMFELSDEEIERQEKLAKKLRSYLKKKTSDDDEWEDDVDDRDGPELDDDGRPVCYGDWKERNRGKRTTDKECSVCEFEVTCRSKSLKGRSKKKAKKKKKSRR